MRSELWLETPLRMASTVKAETSEFLQNLTTVWYPGKDILIR